ncbi:TPA: bacteriocin, partial [Yersinia enterocolitica]
MGYGLIDAARETRQQAMQGLGDASNREIQRESANEQLKSQQKQSQMSMIGVGAGTGMAVGATYG